MIQIMLINEHAFFLYFILKIIGEKIHLYLFSESCLIKCLDIINNLFNEFEIKISTNCILCSFLTQFILQFLMINFK